MVKSGEKRQPQGRVGGMRTEVNEPRQINLMRIRPNRTKWRTEDVGGALDELVEIRELFAESGGQRCEPRRFASAGDRWEMMRFHEQVHG
jgi:hypothetical protein